MRNNLVPLALLIGGSLAAIYLGLQSLELFISGDLAGEEPIAFAIACLAAVLGWRELTATDLHESDERGSF